MTMNYGQVASPQNTPQSEPVSPKQSANNAGGFSFTVDKWKRLERFLILGSEKGTYYVGERKLTLDNAKNVIACIDEDPKRTVDTIVAVSDGGRAPKNDPALFALALVGKKAALPEHRRYAFEALPKVARIGTHLFHFAENIKHLGGWGRATHRAFADWYLKQDAEDLIYQIIKYQQRDGWSHRDILRKVKPTTEDAVMNSIFAYVTGRWAKDADALKSIDPQDILARLVATDEVKTLKEKGDVKKLVKLIEQYDLPREALPTESLAFPEIWEVLLQKMPITALIRNLGKMTSIGVLGDLSDGAMKAISMLTNENAIKKGRVHPLNILVALKTYAQGHGEKGKLTWTANQRIVDALDKAFYMAFAAVEPTGKRFFFGVDVSGSMSSDIAGLPISSAEAAGALAMVTMAVEPACAVYGFADRLTALGISPRCRLDDITGKMQRSNWGGTDASLPFTYALEHKIPADVFVCITDSETWGGAVHPHIALEKYRQKTGIPAKLVVLATAPTEFTIANPDDAGMMDVCGFDTSVPPILADFAKQ
jgi:60 kDa SS-A/Ro ribonucleoprotein